MSEKKLPWSVSQLHVYENCAYQFKLKYIDRIPEPERPLPPGKTEHANDRGSRIHEGNELYVKGESGVLPHESDNFADDIEDLRTLYAEGRVMLEHDWCFDDQWIPTSRSERDSIFIVDFAVWIIPDEWLLIGDYKTGKPYPMKHMDQMQAYALAGFRRYPNVSKITTELWYLDQDDISSHTFMPRAANAVQNSFGKRVERMRTDNEFKPASHMMACRYCAYKAQCPYVETGAKRQGRPSSAVKDSWAEKWNI